MDSGIYDTDDKCDDLSARLDHLLNISPSYYPGDDDIFSRFDGKSIGEGEAAYGSKGDSWISKSIITIFSNFFFFCMKNYMILLVLSKFSMSLSQLIFIKDL